MQTNRTKARLQQGERVYGCFARHPEASLVELLGLHAFDFVIFDGEHTPIDPRDCENLTRAAELRGITPLVRVTTNQPSIILRYMDTGVQGLLVPWVNSGAEAEAAVRAVKYYPRGTRGLGGTRASDYGLIPLNEYVQQANTETLVVLQVETAQAVGNLADIVAVPDVDVIFIGPNDLAHSIGLPGQTQHPEVQALIERIIQTVAPTSIAAGIMVSNAAAARHWQERGVRFITTGIEQLLGAAAREYLATVRRP